MINIIKSNTISEAGTKKKINKLNEIKEVKTKGKRLIDSQKIFLSLFDDLKIILIKIIIVITMRAIVIIKIKM